MRTRVAVLLAGLAAAPLSWPVPAEGSPQLRPSPSTDAGPTVPDLASRTPGVAPAPAWDTFSADVTIRRRLVRKDGTPGPEAPEMRYRWVRSLGDTGWKTTMTVLSASSDVVQTSKGPQAVSRNVAVARIEIGDPASPSRIFDANGRLMFMLPTRPRPTADADPLPALLASLGRPSSAVARSTREADELVALAPADTFERATRDARSRSWVDHLMPDTAGRATRRAALTRQMGAPQGMVRGLERYVSNEGAATTEVLLDPVWAVPVEINVVRDGRLVSHSAVSYQEDPGAGLVRRRIRSEQLLSAESGDRASADIEFANIRLDRAVGAGGVR